LLPAGAHVSSIPVWCSPGRRPLCCRSQTTHPNLPEFLQLFISLVCMLVSETCAYIIIHWQMPSFVYLLSLIYATCNSLLPMAMPVFHGPCCPSYMSWTAFPVSTADSAGHQELISSHEVQERGLRPCTEAKAMHRSYLHSPVMTSWRHHDYVVIRTFPLPNNQHFSYLFSVLWNFIDH
jgi:hypothetical protein